MAGLVTTPPAVCCAWVWPARGSQGSAGTAVAKRCGDVTVLSTSAAPSLGSCAASIAVFHQSRPSAYGHSAEPCYLQPS